MNPNWERICDPENNMPPTNLIQAMGFFLARMSATDPQIKADRHTAQAWVDAVAQFEPAIVIKAFAAHYANQDLAKFVIRPDQARAWVINALPPRPRCPEHGSYYAGQTCGGCRAERLELGLERAIGQSTVPQLSGKSVPMPDHVRAQLNRRTK